MQSTINFLFTIISAILLLTVNIDASYYPEQVNSAETVLRCPRISQWCAGMSNIHGPIFKQETASGAVCVYTSDQQNSCNLSPAKSTCRLLGKTIGPESIRCDPATGECMIFGCNELFPYQR